MVAFKFMCQTQRFNMTLSLHKIDYTGLPDLNLGDYIRIKLKRGNHKFEFTTDPLKKNVLKISKLMKEIKNIVMTMYYDEENDEYLEKILEVKGYVHSEEGEKLKELGTAKINIAEYMKGESNKFALEIILDEDQSSNQNKQCIVTFHVTIEKLSDDTASVNSNQTKSTNSDHIQTKTQPENKIPQQKIQQKPLLADPSKIELLSSDINSFPYSPKSSKKHDPEKSQKKQIRLSIDKLIPLTNHQGKNRPNSKANDQIKEKQYNYKKQQESKYSESKERQNLKNKKQQKYQKNKESTIFNFEDQNAFAPIFQIQKKVQRQRKQENNSQYEDKKAKMKMISPKKVQEQEDNQKQSAELQLFMLKKEMEKKDQEMYDLKIENKGLKKTIQQSFDKIDQIKEGKRNIKELEIYKQQIIQLQLKINQLEGGNKIMKEREATNEKMIENQKQKILYFEQIAQKQKMKIAKIMNKAFEVGNQEIATFIQEEIMKNDQSY